MSATPAGADEIGWSKVLELVTGLDASEYAEVDLEIPGLSLHMSRSVRPASSIPAPVTPASAPAPAAEAASAPIRPQAEDIRGVPIPAPMLGVFYARPAPDKPPFVEVGSEVTPGTTVAIIEVMKMMNTVVAGCAGRITTVCVTEGQMVEFDEPLFLIEESS